MTNNFAIFAASIALLGCGLDHSVAGHDQDRGGADKVVDRGDTGHRAEVIDIGAIQVGHELVVTLDGRPVVIRRLSRDQIIQASNNPIREFPDNLSVSSRLTPKHGERSQSNLVVLELLCPSSSELRPSLVTKAGEDLYFCQHCTERFDVLGRSSGKGFGDKPSQIIPHHKMISDHELKFLKDVK